MKYLHPVIVVLLVLIADQSLKFWVKLNFMYTESLRITDWFYLYFIENEGMAFGWSLGGEWGKLTLSLFRLLAVLLIGYYLVRLVRQKANSGFITSISLIMAGALGNILDSVFYGKIFSTSTPQQLAVLFPDGGGYAEWLHGRVVDMFYFPLYEGFIPHWVPIWGGEYFVFFRPIFNIADASITTGVFLIILFQRQFFQVKDGKTTTDSVTKKQETTTE